jgi:MFS family permease
VADDTSWLWLARLGQGAAASAFSPAASAMVARLHRSAKHGRAFGTYGFYKSLGYTAGPLLGGLLVAVSGLSLLFAVMSLVAVATAVTLTAGFGALAAILAVVTLVGWAHGGASPQNTSASRG